MYIIKDWTDKTCFYGQTFETFEDAEAFLNEVIDKEYGGEASDDQYNEAPGEYWIVEK